jgi:hypothetical protein
VQQQQVHRRQPGRTVHQLHAVHETVPQMCALVRGQVLRIPGGVLVRHQQETTGARRGVDDRVHGAKD